MKAQPTDIGNIFHVILQCLRMVCKELSFRSQNLILLQMITSHLELYVIDLVCPLLKLFEITFMLHEYFLFIGFHQKLFSKYLLEVLIFRILFELAHELNILERVDLKFCELVIEASLAHLYGFCDVRLERELFAGGSALHVPTLSES